RREPLSNHRNANSIGCHIHVSHDLNGVGADNPGVKFDNLTRGNDLKSRLQRIGRVQVVGDLGPHASAQCWEKSRVNTDRSKIGSCSGGRGSTGSALTHRYETDGYARAGHRDGAVRRLHGEGGTVELQTVTGRVGLATGGELGPNLIPVTGCTGRGGGLNPLRTLVGAFSNRNQGAVHYFSDGVRVRGANQRGSGTLPYVNAVCPGVILSRQENPITRGQVRPVKGCARGVDWD